MALGHGPLRDSPPFPCKELGRKGTSFSRAPLPVPFVHARHGLLRARRELTPSEGTQRQHRQSLPVPPTSPVLPSALPGAEQTRPRHPSMVRGDSPVTKAQDEVGHWGRCPRWVTQQPGRPCQLKTHLQRENCMSSLHPFLITPHPAQNPALCHTRSSWHPHGPPSELLYPTARSLRQQG